MISKKGSNLLRQWLVEKRKCCKVSRLGISIYEAKNIDEDNDELLDIVQLPISIYDQRLIKDGTLERLKRRGAEIHARSIYLQD